MNYNALFKTTLLNYFSILYYYNSYTLEGVYIYWMGIMKILSSDVLLLISSQLQVQLAVGHGEK